MTITSLLSATSADGSMVAIAVKSSSLSVSTSTRHLVQIYQVSDSSTTLQLTLTHTSILPLRRLVFVGNKSVLGLLGTNEVVVWDLDRAVVSTTIGAADDQTILAVASNQQDQDASVEHYYYILVKNGTKLLVQEYQESNNKMVRKIKSGHVDETFGHHDDDGINVDASPTSMASLVVTNSRVVVRTVEGAIRIMDKDTGKKTGKIKIKSNSRIGSMSSSSSSVEMNSCIDRPDILVTLQETGGAVLYNMMTMDEVANIPPSKGSQTVTGGGNVGLQLVGPKNAIGSHTYSLLLDDHWYSIRTGPAISGTKQQSSSVTKLLQFASDNPVALFLRSDRKVLAMMYQKSLSECNVEWIDLNDERHGVVPQLFKLGDITKTGLEQNKDVTSKREKRKSIETKVLGPGQAGMEALPLVKKMKKTDDEDDIEEEDNDGDTHEEMNKDDDDDDGDGDDNDAEADGDEDTTSDDNKMDEDDDDNDDGDDETKHVSIAERLQQMTDALDAEEEDEDDAENDDEDLDEGSDVEGSEKKSSRIAFKAKGATTESLKEILTQALQSSDDSMLELALTVRDVKIIATSLRELDDGLLVTLLGKLTARLASTPLRAESLSVWISHCLKYGSYQPEHLAALRNLLYERIESFSDLLRLEGRLSMMVATE